MNNGDAGISISEIIDSLEATSHDGGVVSSDVYSALEAKHIECL